ncbi:hypothetical protein Mpet_1454 [Methanolacinia petrolearia DSM 11571]|uniref:Uncharacterized protein n=1 Tax=Methanolacinia petrolearia (strain DSM 11571 / OCM 486 / SEBR 4847) TaxID=679926 RepID=E1RFI3_METP4|nr:DUF2612 domain-containing protein [Methanolacinia petrolearia]ADN36213.1 hypothetical protein Mpet_1454 [Methanolacinia petrolearia DSM 11571]
MTGRAVSILRRLSSAFRQDTESNNYKLIKINADELDEIDAVIDEIIRAHNLEHSSGQSLDFLAELLELERNERSDDDFRSLIAATAVFRKSNGTIADIKNVVSLITGVSTDDIVVHEDGGNSFSIELKSINLNAFSLTIFNENVDKTRAAGVKYLAEDLVMILNSLWEVHRTREGGLIYIRTSSFQYGLSTFGEAPYGDPCESHLVSPGSVTMINKVYGYGLTEYGSNYGDPGI